MSSAKSECKVALTLEVLVSELCEFGNQSTMYKSWQTIELTLAVDGLSTSAVARRNESHVGHAFKESGKQSRLPSGEVTTLEPVRRDLR